MRTLFTLFGLSLALFSCRTKEPDAVGNPQCHIKCSDPQIKVKLPYTGADLQGMWMIRHTDNYTKHDTSAISGQQTISVVSWADYEIFIPAANSHFIVGAIYVAPFEKDSYCGDECVNPVTGAAVWYNFNVHPCSIVLSAKNEYTIMF